MHTTTSETYQIAVAAPTAFAGGTTNARGDEGGTSDPLTLFTVTGIVEVKIYAKCTVNLASAGGGTLSVGTATNATGLLASTTATDIDAGDIWHDNAPDATVELTSVVAPKLVSENIIETVGTADITAGQVRYDLHWRPMSANGNVVSNHPA